MKTVKFCIGPDGAVTALKAEGSLELLSGFSTEVKRASHITGDSGGYQADLTVSGGPVIGGFSTREAAIGAEVAFINENLLAVSASVRNGLLSER